MDTEREFCSLVDSRSVRLAPLSLFHLERAKSRANYYSKGGPSLYVAAATTASRPAGASGEGGTT